MESSRTERRAARRQRRTESPLLKIPFRQPRNPLPPYEILAPEQVEQLHTASLRILEDIGLDFLDDEALSLWEKAGAKVDRATQHVWLERGLILELIAKAPRSFNWLARNPERNLFIGENALAFGPNGGMVYTTHRESARRVGAMADYEDYLRLTQMCNVLHFGCWEQVTPQDIPPSTRHLHRLRSGIFLTDKALMESAHGRIISADNIEMARLAVFVYRVISRRSQCERVFGLLSD